MLKEIGSEYWIDEIPEVKTNEKPEFLKKQPNLVLTSSGRGAIGLAIEAIKRKVRNKTAPLPAYCCESMILPFKKHGFNIFYYDINTNLEADPDIIRQYIKTDIGIFVHMGYFGFNTNGDIESLLEKLKSSGSFILEDVTHTLFSDFIRNELNDFYIGSVRKWFGIPGGGFISSKDKHSYKLKNETKFSIIRKQALIKKSEYINTWDEDLKSEFLEQFKKAEDMLDNDTDAYLIDPLSGTIIENTDFSELIKKRRENYQYIIKMIRDNTHISCIFPELPDNVCPLFLPVYVRDNRDNFRSHLTENRIYAPVHWPKPAGVDLSDCKGAKYIMENIISIPVDQRYSLADMDRISYIIKSFR